MVKQMFKNNQKKSKMTPKQHITILKTLYLLDVVYFVYKAHLFSFILQDSVIVLSILLSNGV